MNRWHLLAMVILAGLFNLAVSAVRGEPTNVTILGYSALISSGLGAVVLVFDLWLWRLPFWFPWFVATPNINGTWKVTGDVSFLQPGDRGVYGGTMYVKQSFFSIYFTINWDDGETSCLMNAPLAVREGFCAFPAVYEFVPKAGGPASTHRAGFFFYSRDRLPPEVRLNYSTVDLQIGQLTLFDPTRKPTWRTLWTR